MENTRKFHLVLLLLVQVFLECECDGSTQAPASATASAVASAETQTTTSTATSTTALTTASTTSSTTTTTVATTTVTEIHYNGSCSNPEQCDSNMTCQPNNKVCGCEENQYWNGTWCLARISFGGSCTGIPNACVANAKCDADNGNTCRIDLNKSCAGYEGLCVANAKCDSNSGNTCRIDLNKNCAGNEDMCVANAKCDSSSGNTCKIALGNSCNEIRGLCVANAKCDSNSGNTCRIDLNKTCAGNEGLCVANATCDSNSTNTCKWNYGVSCSRISDCLTQYQCSSGIGGTRCLCMENQYWDTTCKNVANLRVTIQIRSSSDPTISFTVQWNRPSTPSTSSMMFDASLNDGNSSQWIADTSYTFNNRTPGTRYTVTVSTRVLKDPGYGIQNSTTSSTVIHSTKPAQPGQLVRDVFPGTNNTQGGRDVTIRFYPSAGHVDNYTVTINTQPQRTTTGTPNGTVVTALFTNLTSDTLYTVTITATSNFIASDVQTGSFRVQAAPAGEVLQLTVPNNGSRWVSVTWKKPQYPNGVMQGYTVKVTRKGESSCEAGVGVICSDCTYIFNETVQNRPVTSDCKAGLHEINKTSTELNDTTLLLEVNVTGLLPDLDYEVHVVAFNPTGPGMDSVQTGKTGQEAAENLKLLTVTHQSATHSLMVKWTPGVRTGNTSYNVTWAEETSLGSNNFTETNSTIIQGYENQAYTITSLLSYWNYKVSVHPVASLGPSPSPTVNISRTLDTEPGELQVFNIKQPGDSAQTLQLTVSCPEERQRNGPISTINYTSTVIGAQSSGPLGKLLETCPPVSAMVNVAVTAETNYTINVFAVTSTGKTGRPRSETFYVKPRAPILMRPDGSRDIVQPTKLASETSYTVNVCPCLANPSQGQIIIAALIVCKEEKDCQSDTNYTSIRSEQTWKKFKDSGYKGRYRPTPNDWKEFFAGQRLRRSVQSALHRVARAESQSVDYTIGDNTTCEQKASPSEYCNGPLPSGTTLFVSAVACTAGGCSVTSTVTIITLTPPDYGPNVGAIVGGITGALVGIAIVVVFVVFAIRRKTRGGASTSAPFEDSLLHRKRLPILLFPSRVEILHKHSNHPFRQDCRELMESPLDNFTCDVGKLEINMIKNRNADILPYDHTRVKLFTRDDRNQDYINASYVSGPQSPCQYIATQAPLISTVPDFWKMVCEQKSQVIVMVADLAENDQMGRYWPSVLNSPAQFGDVTIRVTSSSDLPNYTVRKIAISTMSEATQKVTHIQLSRWRNQVCALPLEDVVDILQVVTSYTRHTGQPVIVHCSDGSGRTGTLIALDLLTRFVENHDVSAEVNVSEVLSNMMKCRPHLIQSETQYMFIHDVLRVVIDRKMQDGHGKGKVYQNMGFTENVYDTTEVYSTIPDTDPYESLKPKGQRTNAL